MSTMNEQPRQIVETQGRGRSVHTARSRDASTDHDPRIWPYLPWSPTLSRLPNIWPRMAHTCFPEKNHPPLETDRNTTKLSIQAGVGTASARPGSYREPNVPLTPEPSRPRPPRLFPFLVAVAAHQLRGVRSPLSQARLVLLVRMAVGGAGVRVPSSTSAAGAPPAMEAWGRKAVTASRGCAGASIRCSSSVGAAGGTAEEHYRTLRLRPGATKGEVKKAFRRLTLMYHPDVCKQRDDDGDSCAMDFQRINVAYQMLMSNMREAEERLEYWRLKYGLTDEDLDKYRYYVNDQVQEDDEWLDV